MSAQKETTKNQQPLNKTEKKNLENQLAQRLNEALSELAAMELPQTKPDPLNKSGLPAKVIEELKSGELPHKICLDTPELIGPEGRMRPNNTPSCGIFPPSNPSRSI